MKHKKLVIFFLSAILVFMIHKLTLDTKIDYLALGDSLAKGQTPFETIRNSYTDYLSKYLENKNKLKTFNNKFIKSNQRITDLTKDIKNAETILFDNKTVTITQAIKNAEIITISIGNKELFYKIHQSSKNFKLDTTQKIFNYIDEMFEDMHILISNIRKLNNKPIILIGYYNPITEIKDSDHAKIESIFNYIDIKFNKLSKQNNVFYVDIYSGFKDKKYYLPNTLDYHPSEEGYNYIANKIIEVIERHNLL